MKLKFYMRGLGIGIILTSIVLSISNHSGQKIVISDKEIIARATELGMKMQEDSNLDEVLEQVKDPSPSPEVTPIITLIPTAKPTPMLTPTPTAKPTPMLTPTPTTKPTPTVTQTPTPTPTVTPEPTTTEETKKITFSVLKGMGSSDVAEVLYLKGLIEDVDEFDHYLIKSGKASSIKVGTFTVPSGASFSEITDKITGK